MAERMKYVDLPGTFSIQNVIILVGIVLAEAWAIGRILSIWFPTAEKIQYGVGPGLIIMALIGLVVMTIYMLRTLADVSNEIEMADLIIIALVTLVTVLVIIYVKGFIPEAFGPAISNVKVAVQSILPIP